MSNRCSDTTKWRWIKAAEMALDGQGYSELTNAQMLEFRTFFPSGEGSFDTLQERSDALLLMAAIKGAL